MKTCLMCNERKEESEFYKIKYKKGYRLHAYCKDCKLKVDSKWRETHQYEMKAYREARKGIEMDKNINGLIRDALEVEHIISMPIEKFTVEQLIELSEKAKKNNLLLSLRAEHSNVHQGVLVCLVKKNVVNELLKYL